MNAGVDYWSLAITILVSAPAKGVGFMAGTSYEIKTVPSGAVLFQYQNNQIKPQTTP